MKAFVSTVYIRKLYCTHLNTAEKKKDPASFEVGSLCADRQTATCILIAIALATLKHDAGTRCHEHHDRRRDGQAVDAGL